MSLKPALAIALFCVFLGMKLGNHNNTLKSFKRMATRWIEAPSETWARLHRPGFELMAIESLDVLEPNARELVEKMQILGWQDYTFTRGVEYAPGATLLQRVTESFWPVKPLTESPRKIALAEELKTSPLSKCKVEYVGKGGSLVDCTSP